MSSLKMIRTLLWTIALLIFWSILVETVKFIIQCLHKICAFFFIWFCLSKIIDIAQQSNKLFFSLEWNLTELHLKCLSLFSCCFLDFFAICSKLYFDKYFNFSNFRMVVIWVIGSADAEDNGIAFEDTDYFLLAVVVFIAFLCRCLTQNL